MALSAAVLIAAAVLAGPPTLGRPCAAPAVAAVPCTAPAPAAWRGRSPGLCLQVIDGRSFCLAEGPTPASWLKVTLAGVADAQDRSDLMAAAFARRVTCVVDQRDQDGVLARCAIDAPSGVGIDPASASHTSPANAATCPRPD